MPRLLDPKELACTARLEQHLRRRGWNLVAGCDEAGRGALLGPLVAAAVILNPEDEIPGLNDSKKLSPGDRERSAQQIRLRALAHCTAFIGAPEVDKLNVYRASRHAMLQALGGLSHSPHFVLTDAMPLPNFRIPHRALIHGDARSVSIAAASILAKVARDAHLRQLDKIYPQYKLGKNKGYGTLEHRKALERLGPCPEHRRSFRPVREMIPPHTRGCLGIY